MRGLNGAAASAGVGIGPVFFLEVVSGEIGEFDDPALAFESAMTTVKVALSELSEKAKQLGRDDAAAILNAQSAMAEDPMLLDEVTARLGEGKTLGDALADARDHIAGMLASMSDEYLAARAHDVREVADRIGRQLAGVDAPTLADISEPSVVVAEILTAAETATMDPSMVLGFVTQEGGPTGHVAVIARSLGLPAIVGVAGLVDALGDASQVVMDGSTGSIVLDPDTDTLVSYQEAAVRHAAQREAAAQYRGQAVTFGDTPMTIAANVAGSADLETAIEFQADGIGLYRTEFLFLDRPEPPSEEEQFTMYKAAVEAFDHPVVVRAFDIGGDKPADYIDIADEENPFLGVRGVRLYDMFPDLFHSQVRALLRAAVFGDLWVMIPMIATNEDVRLVRRHFDIGRAALTEAGIEFGDPKLGIMVEVPSAALSANRMAEDAEFFSIGTNDLTQYTMAADRMSGVLAGYSDAAHPAVLRLCAMTAQAGIEAGMSVGVCGSAGADPVTALLFAAMGIEKLSVAPHSIDQTRALIETADPEQVKAILEKALTADSAEAVRLLVAPLL